MTYRFNCPVCDSLNVRFLTKFFSAPDEPAKFTTHRDKSLVQCGNCGTTNRFPLEVYSKEDFEASGKSYYDRVSADAKEKELFEYGVRNHLELGQVHHYKTLKDKILTRFTDKNRWLDVGSAGAPVAFSDFDFTTIEPDSRVVEFAKKYFKSDKIKCSAIEFFDDDDGFDGICFMHSLYCIPNPISALEKAYSLLTQDGILVIAIGDFFMNSKSPFCDNEYKRIEDIFRGSTMNVYYNPYSLEYLCGKAGFELISDETHSHTTSAFKDMDSRFFIFKKSTIKIYNTLLSKSLEYMENKYLEFFENNTKITKNTIKKINNQNSVLCGDVSVLAELDAIEKLDKIFGFLDGRMKHVCRLNDIMLAPISFFENCSDANLVVCDYINPLATVKQILGELQHRSPFVKILVPNRLSGLDRIVDIFAAEQAYVKAFELQEISWQELFNCSMDYAALVSICGSVSNKKVAIFGSARAGAEAVLFANLSRLSIVCVIDDYSDERFYRDVYPVVDRATFKKEYAADVDLVLVGKYQNGLISQDEIGLPVLKLSESY